MIKKIKIFGLFVLISGGSLFAQVNTAIQPPVKEVLVPETITIKKEQSKELQMKKEVYVPEMTKEQRVDKINKERSKQAEMKKNDVLPIEKKENKMNPATIEESQSNAKLLKIESKEILLNNTEIEK